MTGSSKDAFNKLSFFFLPVKFLARFVGVEVFIALIYISVFKSKSAVETVAGGLPGQFHLLAFCGGALKLSMFIKAGKISLSVISTDLKVHFEVYVL